MALRWNEIEIVRDNGEIVNAKTPAIISASRSTDIPAFYAKWLVNRLKKGYITWYNPFNKSQPYFISFKNAKVFVFWTKNAAPLIPYLNEFDDRGINYYFQYTLNDYEKEKFEPNIPSLKNRINKFKELSEKIGKEKVIWRFDPLIITDKLTPRELLIRIWNIGNQLMGYTNKLVFSFVDVKAYRKVQNNLVKETESFSKESVLNAELNKEQIIEVVEGLSKIKSAWKDKGWDVEMATCCEQDNLEKYGIEHNRCIDDGLMRKLFSHDNELMHFLNYGKLPDNLQGTLFESNQTKVSLKDTGQRKACGCIFSKDIGMYDTCRHHCIYCYANTSIKTVEKNFKLHDENYESIIPPNKI